MDLLEVREWLCWSVGFGAEADVYCVSRTVRDARRHSVFAILRYSSLALCS